MNYKKEKIDITKRDIEILNNFLEEQLKKKLTNHPLPSLEEIKLSDRLETFTQNPVEKLDLFPESEVKTDNAQIDQNKKINKNLPNYNFWLILVVVGLISSSMVFNSYFAKKVDPVLFKLLALSNSVIQDNGLSRLVGDIILRPYVVTIGEYGNYAIAKDEAVRLLPVLKQINIKELDSGILTFEIDQLGSKKEAYSLASELTQRGYEAVHVRYLPKK